MRYQLIPVRMAIIKNSRHNKWWRGHRERECYWTVGGNVDWHSPYGKWYQFSSVNLLSRVWLFVTPWTTACQTSLSITNSWSPPKLMSSVSVMPSNHLILCHPLLLLPSIFPSIRVFSNESALHIRWPEYWSFSFKISLSNEHRAPISSRMDWLDLLAVQGTLKSLLQHHSSKASILRCTAFLIVQFSYPSSQWCHPTISSSVVPFSSCLQSFSASGSFPLSQFFTLGGQSIGVSASKSVFPMNIQDWFPLGWTGWISLQSKGLSRVFSYSSVQKHQFFGAQLSL